MRAVPDFRVHDVLRCQVLAQLVRDSRYCLEIAPVCRPFQHWVRRAALRGPRDQRRRVSLHSGDDPVNENLQHFIQRVWLFLRDHFLEGVHTQVFAKRQAFVPRRPPSR